MIRNLITKGIIKATMCVLFKKTQNTCSIYDCSIFVKEYKTKLYYIKIFVILIVKNKIDGRVTY